jgi:dynein heavy chain
MFLQVTEAEKELVVKLPQLWADLVLKSKNIDASLVVVKRKFTEVTILSCVFLN